MIATDEAEVFMGQGFQTTIDHRGVLSIYIPSTGYESVRITCILVIHLDGKKAPPLIITNGKKNNIERFSGICVLETEKVWCTQSDLRKWINLMVPLVLQGNQKGLFILDSTSTHRAKDIKIGYRRIDQIIILVGMIAYLQTLDIAINNLFKDQLRLK